LINSINEAIIRRETKNSETKIQVTVRPFRLTKQELELNKVPAGFQASSYFVIALALIPASIST